jgi:hypothetical protein
MQRRRCCVSFSITRKLCGPTRVCSSVPGFCSPNFLRLLAPRASGSARSSSWIAERSMRLGEVLAQEDATRSEQSAA